MKPKYSDLKQLAKAFQSGELSPKEWYLLVDNDSAFLSYNVEARPDHIKNDTDEEEEFDSEMYEKGIGLFHISGEKFFDMFHPAELCKMIGIPSEPA